MTLSEEYGGCLYVADISRQLLNIIEYDYLHVDETCGDLTDKKLSTLVHYLKNIGTYETDDETRKMLELAWTAADWYKYKKIYRLHPTFVDYLQDTDSGIISTALYKRLPYKSFYISFPDRPIKETFDELKDQNDVLKGIFIRVFIIDDSTISLGVCAIKADKDETRPSEYAPLDSITTITDGQKLEDVWDYKQLSQEELKGFNIDELDKATAYWTPIYRIALNTCQYLCASNAEIKDIKVKKKDRPLIKGTSKGPKLVNIQMSEVGFRIGERFEAMYSVSDPQTRRESRKGGWKVRPHVRRAHWHHYWTGKGRTDICVKWIEPVFVMGNGDSDVVIHEVKGKRE